MKILRLTAENVKKIKVVDISPDGSVVQITGPNGSGKSSVLDCIWFALGGTRGIDSRPVRAGTHKAKIKLDLGEIIVTRGFTDAGGTSLVVEAENGARFPSPQKMLDDLLGSLTFDPLAFSRMEPKAQLEVLRGMVKIDYDIDELDRLNAVNYADRTEANRLVRQLEARAASVHSDPSLPHERVDVNALLMKMEEASDHNEAIDSERNERIAQYDQVRDARARISALRSRAAAELDEANDLESRFNALEVDLDASPELPERIEVSLIRRQIEAASHINENIEQRKLQAEIKHEIDAAASHIDALNATMVARAKMRAEAIAAADMPIEGLSFGDGEVLYNDLPFAQASSAEQLRVSVAIAMAANPKLRVLRIKDGSLLDENGLALISEMAAENDYQVWIERVDTSGRVGVVMEDGAIVGAEEQIPALAGVDEE